MSADQTQRDAIATAALGVFDNVSPATLSAIRRRAPRAGSVQISPRALAGLLEVLEDVYGSALVEGYVKLHREGYDSHRAHRKALEAERSAAFVARIEAGG